MTPETLEYYILLTVKAILMRQPKVGIEALLRRSKAVLEVHQVRLVPLTLVMKVAERPRRILQELIIQGRKALVLARARAIAIRSRKEATQVLLKLILVNI